MSGAIEEIHLKPSEVKLESELNPQKHKRVMLTESEGNNRGGGKIEEDENHSNTEYVPRFGGNLVESVVHSLKHTNITPLFLISSMINHTYHIHSSFIQKIL